MKKLMIGFLGGLVVAVLPASAQDFTNLNFEAAQNLPSGGGSVAIADALPGWTAFNSTGQLSQISYNAFASPVPVDLVSSNSFVIDGNFSVFLDSGSSISQTGLVPSDARSLYFKERSGGLRPPSANYFVVSLGGQVLALTLVSQTAPNFDLWGADISAFAGQTTALTFSSPGGGGPLDDIQFSSTVIPEPSTSWLLLCGTSVLVWSISRQSSFQNRANRPRLKAPNLT